MSSRLVALVLDGERSLYSGQGLISLDSYSVFTHARLSQVVRSLTVQPEISAGPSGLLQANGHVGLDRRMTVQYPRKGMARNSQNLSSLGHA